MYYFVDTVIFQLLDKYETNFPPLIIFYTFLTYWLVSLALPKGGLFSIMLKHFVAIEALEHAHTIIYMLLLLF